MTATTLVKAEPDLRDRQFISPEIPAPQSTFTLRSSRVPVLPGAERCPVCFRAACPLRSHKQYARARGLNGRTKAQYKKHSSSSLSTTSTEGAPDSRVEVVRRLAGIGETKVDSFINFPLPKGVKAEVHQLFQDCRPATVILNCSLFSCFESSSLLYTNTNVSKPIHAIRTDHLMKSLPYT